MTTIVALATIIIFWSGVLAFVVVLSMINAVPVGL